MTAEKLFRAGGIGLAVGCAVSAPAHALTDIMQARDPLDSGALATIGAAVLLVASVVVVLSLPVVAVWHPGRSGVLRVLGYVFFGVALLAYGVASEAMAATVVPSLPRHLAENPPAALIAMLVVAIPFGLGGLVLLGIGTLRSGLFAAWTGWAFIVSAVLLILTNAPVPQLIGGAIGVAHDTLFYAASFWIGVTIARGREVPRQAREQRGVAIAST
jgi:hypothetical protein